MPKKIKVVIVSFNTKHLLLRCIQSLLEQEEEIEINISDNGSKDGTIEAVKGLAQYNKTIQLFENGTNLGFAKACNLPLSDLDTPYVLFLNPDTVVPPETLAAMRTLMDEDLDIGIAGPLILNESGTEQRGCRRREPTPSRAFAFFLRGQKSQVNLVDTPIPQSPVEVDAISGAFMFVRTAAIKDVGLMDEGYFLHVEDLDWCKRFRIADWKVVFNPKAIVTHTKGGSSGKRLIQVEWHKHRGMVRYYRKFYANKQSAGTRAGIFTAVWLRFFIMAPIWGGLTLRNTIYKT